MEKIISLSCSFIKNEFLFLYLFVLQRSLWLGIYQMMLEIIFLSSANKAIEQKESTYFMDNNDGIYF
jgi:hypothetical protein